MDRRERIVRVLAIPRKPVRLDTRPKSATRLRSRPDRRLARRHWSETNESDSRSGISLPTAIARSPLRLINTGKACRGSVMSNAVLEKGPHVYDLSDDTVGIQHRLADEDALIRSLVTTI